MLRAVSLAKRFGGVRAVQDVTLEIEPGAVHSIIGPNGAGKTTLLNLLSGIEQPDLGEILFDGNVLTGAPQHRFAAAGIGRTFQNLQIFFNMSALENVMAGAWLRQACGLAAALVRAPRLARAERRAREEAHALLDFVGLARWAQAASDAGRLQRVLCRLLSPDPPDERVSSVDQVVVAGPDRIGLCADRPGGACPQLPGLTLELVDALLELGEASLEVGDRLADDLDRLVCGAHRCVQRTLQAVVLRGACHGTPFLPGGPEPWHVPRRPLSGQSVRTVRRKGCQ